MLCKILLLVYNITFSGKVCIWSNGKRIITDDYTAHLNFRMQDYEFLTACARNHDEKLIITCHVKTNRYKGDKSEHQWFDDFLTRRRIRIVSFALDYVEPSYSLNAQLDYAISGLQVTAELNTYSLSEDPALWRADYTALKWLAFGLQLSRTDVKSSGQPCSWKWPNLSLTVIITY